MEIKSAFKIDKNLEVEDDGLELQFTPEEIKRIAEQAEKKGIPIEKLMKETIKKAVKDSEAQVADIMLKKLEEYQNEAKKREAEKRKNK